MSNTPSGHPLRTAAALKRVLRPGDTVRIINHVHRQMSRVAVVMPGTNTVDLCLSYSKDDGSTGSSHSPWPKRGELRPDETDERTVHWNREGAPYLTLTVLGSEAPGPWSA